MRDIIIFNSSDLLPAKKMKEDFHQTLFSSSYLPPASVWLLILDRAL